jgi:ketosteroid isomerase-like protein
MSLKRLSILLLAFVAFTGLTPGCYASDRYAGTKKDRDSLEETSKAIRAAFARGDLDTIMQYHHPSVIKALSKDKYLVGRYAVRADLATALRDFNLEFTEHRVENLLFQGKTAVEESTFTITGTPRNGGASFSFKGRAMVIYIRYKKSPTGWASIREIIQPGT